jgi:DNA-directed RNA polymerase subunit RPC12/RpoP
MNVDFNPNAMECPRCGKHVLVERESGHYRCLWCGFERDISAPGDITGRI